MTAAEEWRPVVGWEGLYEVSDLGRVRSLDRIVSNDQFCRGKVLKHSLSKYGYSRVFLQRGGKSKTCSVHSLVAAAFIGPRPPGMEINHKDLNKTNPRASNLEYLTHLDNLRDYWSRPEAISGGRHHLAKLSDSQIKEARELRARGASMKSIGQQLGVSRSLISAVINRRGRFRGSPLSMAAAAGYAA